MFLNNRHMSLSPPYNGVTLCLSTALSLKYIALCALTFTPFHHLTHVTALSVTSYGISFISHFLSLSLGCCQLHVWQRAY